MGFLDPPPPLRQHVFSTKNKQKLAFSEPPSPPKRADVIYEWSLEMKLLSFSQLGIAPSFRARREVLYFSNFFSEEDILTYDFFQMSNSECINNISNAEINPNCLSPSYLVIFYLKLHIQQILQESIGSELESPVNTEILSLSDQETASLSSFQESKIETGAEKVSETPYQWCEDIPWCESAKVKSSDEPGKLARKKINTITCFLFIDYFLAHVIKTTKFTNSQSPIFCLLA